MILFFNIKEKMKNTKNIKHNEIIKGTYYYGSGLPPQLNTPSAIKYKNEKFF